MPPRMRVLPGGRDERIGLSQVSPTYSPKNRCNKVYATGVDMQRTNGRLITPSEYARLRGLNRSTISRQIASGAIPTVGGLLDPRAADLAREKNLNGIRRNQAARRKAEREAENKATIEIPQ